MSPRSSNSDNQLQLVQGLFLKHLPGIRAAVLGMVTDFSLADDIIQEAFLVVSKKADTFEPGTNFSAWVRKICLFKTKELLRQRHRKHEALSDQVLEALCAEPWAFTHNTDSRLLALESCLEQLAPAARRSIELRYLHDHQPPEIAQIVGCAIASTNVTLSRARAFLRLCVDEFRKAQPI